MLADLFNNTKGRYQAGALLILAGIFLGVFALVRGVSDYQVYNSPFDEVDYAPEADEGFLALFSGGESGEPAAARAPTLDSPPQAEASAAAGEAPASAGAIDGNPEAATEPPEPEALNPARAAGANPAAAQTTTARQTWIPEFISIPAIQVRAPIVPVAHTEIEYKRQIFQQWQAPNAYAAGWHNTSAPLGVPGNTVLNGHHNAFEEVFRDLLEVEEGDIIQLTSGDRLFTYQVGLKLVLNERFKPVDVRLANAQWILPSQDERLTLITCWPYESNTHRVILVALPTGSERVGEHQE